MMTLEWQCKILKIRSGSIDWLTDDKSETPLHLAITHKCKIEIIETLLNYESNVLERNDDGNNALHLCAMYNNDVNILNALMKRVTLDDLTVFNYEGELICKLIIN